MFVISVGNWIEYLDLVSGFLDGTWYFRGHAAASFELKPSIGRGGLGKPYRAPDEVQLFDRFKWEKKRFANVCDSDLEALAIGRHHGLPTRLLDWSSNPLTAAFFAVEGLPQVDGAVHMIRVCDDVVDRSMTDPFSLPATAGVALVAVPPREGRVSAQQGIFSLHPDPCTTWDPDAGGTVVTDYVVCTIPAAVKTAFHKNLSQLDFHRGRLMTDLDGLCEKLRQDYIWR